MGIVIYVLGINFIANTNESITYKLKIMKNLKCILSSFLCLLCFQAAFAQDVDNVRVSTTDRDVLVTYDLIGEPNTEYFVDLKFRMDGGESIRANAIKGDVGEVMSGKDKVAIWKVYEDVNGLKGGIEPIFDVRPVPQPKVSVDNKPAVVEPTPTPPNNMNDKPIIDIIDEEINGRKKNRTGIKISLGNSRVSVDKGTGSFSREFSWEGGLYHRYNFNRKLYIQPELLYHRHRYKQRTNDFTNTYTHNQLRGQVIGGIKPIGLGLYFNAGLYYAYQLNGNREMEQDGNTIETQFSNFPEQNGETDPFNSTDFGYILGGTLSFNRGGFALSLLFSQSFDSVVNAAYFANDADNDGLSLRHKSFHFAITKKF